MQVVITKLSLADMAFQLDTDYNPTVSDKEVFSEDLLVSEVPPDFLDIPTPAPPFPFEILLFAGGAVGVVAVAGGIIYYWRKKRYV